MKRYIASFISVTGALLILFALYESGGLEKVVPVHPVWKQKATLFGAIIGTVATVFILWLRGPRIRWSRNVVKTMGILFPFAVFITWHYAQLFINSSNFERFAGLVWGRGYFVLIALFTALMALFIRRIFRKRHW